MNITIVRESLLNILQKSGYFISNKISDLKIFKAVLVSARQDGVVINTTNINEYFSGEIGGKVYKTGAVLVDFKTLFEIVKNLNDAKITLEKTNKQLVISGKAGEIKLVSLDETNFPLFQKTPKTTELPSVFFDSDTIQSVFLSCATDEARPILTGLCFDFQEKETRIVGTDGFRMSLSRFEKTIPELVGQKLVLSGKSLTSILKIFKTKLPKILLSQTEKKIIFIGEGLTISTRLLEGEFPPYERVIPQTHDTLVTLKKEDFFEAVRSSSLFAKEGSNMLDLVINKETLTVSSVGAGVGEAVFKVGVENFSGKENKIVFNYRYLLDYLNNSPDGEVVLEMTSAFAPGVFRNNKTPKNLHIIMPIRSQE